MKVQVVLGNIVDQPVEAIVNAANPPMLGGGGVDGAIHKAAGPSLRMFCEMMPEVEPGVRCRVGEIRITPGFDLAAKWIIHTVGPMFPGSRPPMFPGERQAVHPTVDLFKCLVNCLEAADEMKLQSLAIPAISCGVYGGSVETFANVLYQVVAACKCAFVQRLVVTLFTPLEYDEFMAVWPDTTWPD